MRDNSCGGGGGGGGGEVDLLELAASSESDRLKPSCVFDREKRFAAAESVLWLSLSRSMPFAGCALRLPCVLSWPFP